MKESLQQFLNQEVKLVKDDNFVIWGRITRIHDDCVEFFTDGRIIILSFERISEIAPFRNNRRNFNYWQGVNQTSRWIKRSEANVSQVGDKNETMKRRWKMLKNRRKGRNIHGHSHSFYDLSWFLEYLKVRVVIYNGY